MASVLTARRNQTAFLSLYRVLVNNNHRSVENAIVPWNHQGCWSHLSRTTIFRQLSESTKGKQKTNRNDKNNVEDELGDDHQTQDFVDRSIHPGEWDEPDFQNPFYRPKYTHRAKILSKEDFRNRPAVGVSAYFDSPADAMVTLSWMTNKDRKEIFEMYKALLKTQHARCGSTSHEYIMRCIAQKLNLRADRVAGAVQLQFNEERYRLEGEELADEAGKYMDNSFLTEIRLFYKAFNMTPPNDLSFVEPIIDDEADGAPSPLIRSVDDIFDMDGLLKRYQDEYLPNKAKDIVSKHKYVEDVDDESIITPVDKETESFVEQQKKLADRMESFQTDVTPKVLKETDRDNPSRRKRFKFVAKMVNTREKKKLIKEAKRKPILTAKEAKKRSLMSKAYTTNSIENTVVEYDGRCRRANMNDVRNVEWKPMKHELGKRKTIEEQVEVMERIYRNAKRDWLNYIHGREHTGVFGTDGKISPKSIKLAPPSSAVTEDKAETDTTESTEDSEEASKESETSESSEPTADEVSEEKKDEQDGKKDDTTPTD